MGKGEMVRQELTGGRVTGRPCKPHPEQDLIGGYGMPGPTPGWSQYCGGNTADRWMVTAPLTRRHRNRLIGLLGIILGNP